MDKLNNMIGMEIFNRFLIGWTSAILGRSTREKRLVTMIDVNNKEQSLTPKGDEVQILTVHKR